MESSQARYSIVADVGCTNFKVRLSRIETIEGKMTMVPVCERVSASDKKKPFSEVFSKIVDS